MSLPEVEIPTEPVSETDKFCATCPELGTCAIIGGMKKLDKWNKDNPVPAERAEDNETPPTEHDIEVSLTRLEAGELGVHLGEIQNDCVASMQVGGESLQETAVSAIAGSRVCRLAQKERRV